MLLGARLRRLGQHQLHIKKIIRIISPLLLLQILVKMKFKQQCHNIYQKQVHYSLPLEVM